MKTSDYNEKAKAPSHDECVELWRKRMREFVRESGFRAYEPKPMPKPVVAKRKKANANPR